MHLVDSRGDRRVAGSRFSCENVLLSGKVCSGVDLPSIGKARGWSLTLAEHAPAAGTAMKRPFSTSGLRRTRRSRELSAGYYK